MEGLVLLFVVFLVLKLTGVIAWPWLYVTMPLWIWGLIVAVTFILIGLATYIKDKLYP